MAFISIAFTQSGYELWLDFKPLDKGVIKSKYNFIKSYYFTSLENNQVLDNTEKVVTEKIKILFNDKIRQSASLKSSNQLSFILDPALTGVDEEGYKIESTRSQIQIKAVSSIGLLYGALDILNRINSGQEVRNLSIVNNPKVKLRLLNHWDNLDRTVERGYAGFSIFNWHELPEMIDERYHDYALANASIGINGVAVTNVNANALILRADYLEKVAALANVFSKYGIKIYLTARFSAPIELGGLKTADPLIPEVRQWWEAKIEEIYKLIPDFGGFLVKANSEGQPGPQDYERTHADGANMLAIPLEKFGGIVMWRAFVYSHEVPEDRCKQAYNEFVPLDGQFHKNVMVQVKNGPLDFQPREPIHPLFGAMSKTPLMLELQITKEYLGQGTHLVGLANMYKEILDTDTYAKGKGSKVAKVVDGSLYNHELTGIAGVSNIGTAMNWTGNLFAQADWFAFGRLAWNPDQSADSIFKEWATLTFKNSELTEIAKQLLDMSHEACVNYMTPLGLHHIMAEGHHFGPGPWVDNLGRADWTSVYYHRATKDSIGFDRTNKGSAALQQYSPEFRAQFEDLKTCPEEYLLWFHRIPWSHKMKSGNTFWEELVYKYDSGVKSVIDMKTIWTKSKNLTDEEIYKHVESHLQIQLREAQWWRDACLAYFQSLNKLPFPSNTIPPPHAVDYYKNLEYPYAPGIRPRW
jgi:alpha-glucuronidase